MRTSCSRPTTSWPGKVSTARSEPGSWLLYRTDWSKRQGREAFLNAREDGSHTPGFHPDCVRFLAHERDVLGVGVETVGTDAGQAGGFDPMFPSHNIMHGSGRFGWPASPTWTNCRPLAPSSSPPRSRSSTAPAARCASWPSCQNPDISCVPPTWNS